MTVQRKILLGLGMVPLLFVCLILVLPYTGALEGLIWRMPPAPVGPSGKNLAEELGFPADTRLLVVNSDDTGANPVFTDGVVEVMAHGMVRSNSVIVTDRNDAELVRIATIGRSHPEWGFGVHLALTNEYQSRHAWAPVLPASEAPSLRNAQGLSWEKITEVEQFVDPAEAEREFVAQIQKALAAGIEVTHLDSHMGTAYRKSSFPGAAEEGLTTAAINAAKRFDLPLTLNTFDARLEPHMRSMDELGLIRPDTFFGFYELEEMNSHLSYKGPAPQKWVTAWVVRSVLGFELPYENRELLPDDIEARTELYQQALRGVAKPGLNHFFMHAASEGHGHTIPTGRNHEEGVDRIVRLGDSAVWSSPEMADFLKEERFELVNYTDILAVQRRWRAAR